MPAEAELPFSLARGEVLAGRYEIGDGLGRGAMGEVYAARDLDLREDIAIKLLRPQVVHHDRVLERFRREIQAARRVTHPNVCRVFDLVIENRPRRVFLTMERLAGPTLAEDLAAAGGPLPFAKARGILAEIAAGLDAAHEVGIVHRDLKPENVILVPPPMDGNSGRARAVLTDFGVAWSVMHAGAEAEHLTSSGLVIGSPAYMAPEQLRGDPVSAESDVFALGVLAYEMLTGRLPFEGETAFLTALKRIEEDPIPPESWVPDLPAGQRAALRKALARRPEDRFASAGELVAALAADPAPVKEDPTVPRLPRGRARWLAIALVIAAAVAGAVYVLLQ